MATAYIETTIPSYYVARPSNVLVQAARQTLTRTWWDGGYSGFELYTSLPTIEEAARGEEEMARARLTLIDGIPLLEVNDQADALARELIGAGVIPSSAAPDATHIAVASVHGLDFLVTWNFRHIANPFIRDRLQGRVTHFGARLPVICTPEELLQDDESH
jgi:predicted nucleic acid-binding protein